MIVIAPFTNNILVTYYDCDVNVKMKISSLIRHMMNAATDHANALGIGYEVLTARNMAFLLAKNIIQIIRLPSVDEEIKIKTVMTEIKGAKFIRELMVEDKDSNILANCLTVWMLVNTKTRKILRPSELDEFSLSTEQSIHIEKIKDTKLPKDFIGDPFIDKKIIAEYSYIDSNNHVNNSYYFDFICNAIPYAELIEKGVQSIELAYINEVLPETNINLKGYRTNEENQYHFISQKDGHKFFEAIVKMND